MTLVYKGFSTVNKKTPPYLTTDVELVKIDLLNQFNTKRGERVMLPTFGTRIFELIHDPLDVVSTDIIINEVREVIASEPRVRLVNTPTITELDQTVMVEVELYFIAQETADHLYITFVRDREVS
jgi:phage baseplate assembly protein W